MKRLFLITLLILLLQILYYGKEKAENRKIKTFFLNVGQGDATLLRTKNIDILVDGGPDKTVLRQLGNVRTAWDRTIEVVIVTHPDADHLAGIFETIKKYGVNLVIMPRVAKQSGLYFSFLQRIKEKGIKVAFAKKGDVLKYGDLELTVVSPDETVLRWGLTRSNLSSVVTLVKTPIYSLLLTGDIEASVENYLLRNESLSLKADIIKIPHHGSKTSTSGNLLAAVNPSVAVISVGKNNYGHPNYGVLERLKKSVTLRTDKNGSVFLFSNKFGESYIRCEKECQ